MKYVIKHQKGGGFNTFSPYIRSTSTERPTSGSSEETGNKSGSKLLDDKLYGELLKGGLINDVNNFVDQLLTLESQMGMGSLFGSDSPGQGVRLIAKVNEVRRNKELYTNAANRAYRNGSLGEVAVGNYGEIFIRTGNEVKAVSTEDYSKNRSKYGQVLTVRELLEEREKNPKLAWDTSIFSLAENSVGMNQIQNHISSIVDSIGKESFENTTTMSRKQLEGLTGVSTSQSDVESLAKLKQLLDLGGDFYKITQGSTTERRHLGQALNYIWKTLDVRAQNKLNALAKINGTDPQTLITNILTFGTDHQENYSGTMIEDPSKSGSGKSVSLSDLSLLEIQTSAKSGISTIPWNDVSTGLRMDLIGDRVELIEDAGTNKLLPLGPIADLLNSHTGAVLEKNNVFFGDKRITLNDLNNIIVDSSAGAARVYFPVDNAGNPDYDLMRKIDDLRKRAPKNLTPEQLTKYFKDNGFNYIQFDKEFKIIPNETLFKPFLLSYGYVDERSNIWENNGEVRELEGNEEDGVKEIISSIYDSKKMGSPTGIFNWSNTYYKGMILIPYQENASTIASAISKNVQDKKHTIEDYKIGRKVSEARTLNPSSNIFN